MILLPCPFCGSDAAPTTAYHGPRLRHFIICTNLKCGCSLIPRNTFNQAVTQWNLRAIQLSIIRHKPSLQNTAYAQK
jgi:hypothetical protein